MTLESRGRWCRGLAVILLAIVAALVYLLLSSSDSRSFPWQKPLTTRDSGNDDTETHVNASLPDELMGTVYSKRDFVNEKGIVPPFWGDDEKNRSIVTWGPCFPPKHAVNWTEKIQLYANETSYHPKTQNHKMEGDLSDYCRPGFLIIGAGKCGTSSLYHYLTGHPRVLPASQKQIHYFKYYFNYPMKWYLAHFPTATSFLASGALMTGEASPGYLPYPSVARRAASQMHGSKIVAVGREPIDRAYSSYRYNYVAPATDILRRGSIRGIPGGKSDEYYHENHLFSFEEMMKAELAVLKECLAPDGPGQVATEKAYGRKWARDEFQRRKDNGLPPLIDLDGTCYGDRVSKQVPRKQWADLLEQYPDKFVDTPHLFLTQALLGRSLYALPLEWYYITFSRDDIFFLCTEEMRDLSGEPINELGQFLGLPSYNFSGVVSEGMYNVGGHKGYDKEVTWEEVEQETEEHTTQQPTEIPLSEEFRQELSDFVKPLNERLFKLIGRRCNW